MKKLEVGMRVRVVRGGYLYSFKGKITHLNEQFNTVAVTEDGFYSNHGDSPFHPCQIRILKKKAKPVVEERKARRVWVKYNKAIGIDDFASEVFEIKRDARCVEFQEVPPGTVTISRGDLERAWNEVNWPNSGVLADDARSSKAFSSLAKQLGLEEKK